MEGEHWKLEMASISRLRTAFNTLDFKLRPRNVATRRGLFSRGLFSSVQRRIIDLDFSKVRNERLHPIVSSRIHELENEWYFVRTFLYCVDYWDDAKIVVKNLESVIGKIDCVANETAHYLMKHEKKYWKLIDVISESQKKIEFLKPEIEEVVQSLIGCKFELKRSVLDYFFFNRFLNILMRDLDTIKKRVDPSLQGEVSYCRYELSRFEKFLYGFDFYPDPLVSESVDFMEYVASVFILMAEQCCLYWFKDMDSNDAKSTIFRLSNLQENMLPSNSECLELIFKLLKIKNVSHKSYKDPVDSFLRYLFHPEQFGIHDELKGLVTFAFDRAEKSIVDVESFCSVIKAVLGEAGSLLTAMYRASKDVQLELLAKIRLVKAKIWLLKMEVFLQEQLSSSTNSILSMNDQLETFSEGPKSIFRIFSKDVPKEKTEDGKQTFMLVEEVAREVMSLCKSFHVKKITKYMVRVSLFMVLLKILLFKAERFVMELLNGSGSFIALKKDQIETLHEGVRLLVVFIANQTFEENAQDVELICAHIEVVARRVIFLYYSFLANEITEEMITKMNLLLSDLLVKVNHIKAKLREICSQVPRSNFPKINRLAFVDSVLTNLVDLQNYKADSVVAVKHHIEELHGDIAFLKSFVFRNIEEQDTEYLQVKNLGRRITEMAYEIEYVIDSIEVGSGVHWQHLLWLYDLLEEIRLIKTEATKFYEKQVCDVRVNNVVPSSSYWISQTSALEIDEVVASLGDQEEIIIDQLTRGTSQRDIVSIVGMPGIGKTTLAKKVYNNSMVAYHFHIRAWCCVSQVYSKRELLLDILSDISGLTDSNHLMSDDDLDLELYQKLKQKRYLIVMDDLWNTSAWDGLQASFPNDGNGSRILMTSRLHDISLQAGHHNDPHPVRLLTDEESWKLLQMKIFHEEDCPEELFEVGKKIAQNCKGLPLAIVAAAGLLKRMEKNQVCWNQIVDSLSSRIVDDPQTRCMDVLELSYKHLPDNLKACFLYFGAFLEDKDIPVCRLIWLWIAEGFIQKSELKSLEDHGKDYLLDLIGRSLVLVAKRRSTGGVKTCRIHDLLRDLCLSKAKEKNFLQPVTRYDEPYASFDDSDYGSNLDYYYPSNSIRYEKHRICFYLERKNFVHSRPSGSWTRSLLFFATSDTYPRCPYEITFISQNFKLLRVLDLECINAGSSFPAGIVSLVKLRYLAVSGDIDSVPSSIANLWKLETLIVKGLKGKIVLPDTLWTMASLRHVHVNPHAVFSLEDEELVDFSQLDNLLTLSSPALSCGRDTETTIRKICNLQKLRCIYLGSSDDFKNFNQFPRLDLLTRLESLNMLYYGRTIYPEFRFPRNLKKLTLSNFRLPWQDISVIGRLKHLEVLKLLSRAFNGQRWDMTEGEFLKLKFLKLDTLNVVQWNATSDHLPNLEQLVLHSCNELEEVPSCFVEIPTLQMIEVQHCRQSTEESVRKIEEEGIEGLKILINHSIFYS